MNDQAFYAKLMSYESGLWHTALKGYPGLDPEELVQLTILDAIAGRAKFEPRLRPDGTASPDPFYGFWMWLWFKIRSAASKMYDAMRKAGDEHTVELKDEHLDLNYVGPPQMAHMQWVELDVALDKIPELEATAIRMSLEGNTLAAIGRKLDVSPAWAGVLRNRAIVNLRKHLGVPPGEIGPLRGSRR